MTTESSRIMFRLIFLKVVFYWGTFIFDAYFSAQSGIVVGWKWDRLKLHKLKMDGMKWNRAKCRDTSKTDVFKTNPYLEFHFSVLFWLLKFSFWFSYSAFQKVVSFIVPSSYMQTSVLSPQVIGASRVNVWFIATKTFLLRWKFWVTPIAQNFH